MDGEYAAVYDRDKNSVSLVFDRALFQSAVDYNNTKLWCDTQLAKYLRGTFLTALARETKATDCGAVRKRKRQGYRDNRRKTERGRFKAVNAGLHDFHGGGADCTSSIRFFPWKTTGLTCLSRSTRLSFANCIIRRSTSSGPVARAVLSIRSLRSS